MPIEIIVILVLLIILLLIIICNIKIVPQAQAYVMERLGAYHSTWGTGLHVKIPFVDRISRKVSLKEQVVDFPPQPVITKDNVTMQIDTVVYFQITDPKMYTYGVERPISAIENLTATTLRNIIGDLELDHTLTSRDVINSKIRVILDEATDAWGIKVNRVELKNILPPPEIQDAMEKQMKAERERRAKILDAEGAKRSEILVAEGHKEAAILRADAMKETKIREAQGEAEAIRSVQQAYADSLKLLEEVVRQVSLKGYKIINIDSTILAQTPKMAPYIEQMRKNIANACNLDFDFVSVKATTEEGLGFTGKKEGIAAHAVCLIDNK